MATDLHVGRVTKVVMKSIIGPNADCRVYEMPPDKHTCKDGHHHRAYNEARGLLLSSHYGYRASCDILKKYKI